MSLAPIAVPDRQQPPSPRTATVTLASNNPFRNIAGSASPTTSLFVPGDNKKSSRPLSTNPFLDNSEIRLPPSPRERPREISPKRNIQPMKSDSASDLFGKLSLDGDEKSKLKRPPPRSSENVPPNRAARRPSRDDRDQRRPSKQPDQPLIDVFADSNVPSKSSSKVRNKGERRPRRNSESSVMERTSRIFDDDDEKRRRERRRREREQRHRDGKSSRSKKVNHKLDIIDKLDVTGIYGPGLFHHDGPFDACNPHRNRKGIRTAPMLAFPKDSRNMALGGAGPNKAKIDLNQFHGRGTEGYADYGVTPSTKSESANFDPTSRIEPIHGTESLGLGTSTFLEGTPASRAAIQKRETEAGSLAQDGGLQRKKSLAQRVRGISNRNIGSGRVMSPEPLLERPLASSLGSTPSTHRPSTSRRANDKNPFGQDYDDAYDKKGAKIKESGGYLKTTSSNVGERPRSTSTPKPMNGTQGRRSSDGGQSDEGKGMPRSPMGTSGFMDRMKSLRRKPERKATG